MMSVSESVTHELPNSSDRVDPVESPVASATGGGEGWWQLTSKRLSRNWELRLTMKITKINFLNEK